MTSIGSIESSSKRLTPLFPGTFSTSRPRTLIADDQPDVIAALRLLLKGEGYQTEAVSSPAAAIEAIEKCDFDLVLIDLNYARDTTSGREGLDLLARIRSLDPMLPVIVMTAWGSIELAVEATRSGSSDFIQKPWDNGHLLEVVRKQLELGRELRLKHQLEAAREQSHARELAEAREIQRWLLPREIPQILNCEISAVWQPVREVSGDYFDVMKFNDHQTALCIADVMGKGMPAALLMANLQAVMRSFASSTTSPKDLCARINSLICSNVDAGKFITLFYGLVDMNEKRLLYTNAGHNAPVLIHRDGSCERLSEGGTVLGLIYDGYYSMGEVELRSGDRLVMFTDGLTEARDANDEEFGEERLLNLLRGFKELAARELEQEITRAVNEFSQGEMGDDMTMIVVAVD